MHRTHLLSLTGAALLAISAAGGFALAGDDDEAAEAAALHDRAKISLAEAVAIAEERTGGRAAEAEFDVEDNALLWTVETMTRDGAEMEVEIDAVSGAILEVESEEDDD
ncbi:hypothetical protein PB2503_00335 [Parvularcula bermudensis HTCC2503]|uniref:PepSY domain-containing protein n=1 Tax=Parvularcula bermudensis (strain ATCC BAA-594 / HTCC2503 / KCTC 12087) TaxID=314260 RepID=E0TIH6_PARBH|nr:PepSY domain-containing protein [Parvularcula bermudensis]ADM10834.1 hypothetical protein PB2503_00335 [Parvularcula bermudensis HTCC2503]